MILDRSIYNKTVMGWSLYDFANSAFATTILAVIFNKYFAQVVAGGESGVLIWGFRIPGAALFGYVLSMSYAMAAFMAPVLGAIADETRARKKFLGVFCCLGVLCSALLYFVHAGDVLLGSALFVLANVGFAGGNVFYNAFLPDISTEENVGRISGIGWAFGYIGGGLLLALNLVMLQFPHWLGFPAKAFTVGHCFVSVAFWWGIFALPFFFWVREPRHRKPVRPGSGYLSFGFSRVIETLRHLRQHREFAKFLVAYLLFNDGIETVIVFASIFGATVVGMETHELILFFLVIQGTAFLGSLLLGFLSDRLGQKWTLMATLFVWTGVVLWAYFMGFWDLKKEYWILGILSGTVLGGSQSIARSMAGRLIPPERSAEFFGFYAISGRFAAIFGPALYSSVIAVTGSMRSGVLSLGVLFLAGMICLAGVRVKEKTGETRLEGPGVV